jgi:1-acyl-sn-glycerol-3-phosphate acyltransferase
MAADMRRPELEPFWRWLRVIFVDRRTGSAESLRDAVQALRDGAVIGIFPEGYIERPPEQLLPFQPGIGLLIRRSSAPVLPVLIRGTPATPTAWGSLIRRSRSVVEFMPIISYADRKLSAGEIASDLQSRYLAWTGWPMERTPDARITSELRSG